MARLKNGNLWLQCNTQQLSGTKTLSNVDNQYQFLDPNGADRDTLLPNASTAAGLEFTIVNTGSGYNLIVKNSTATTVFAVIPPGDVFKFVCNGVIWKAPIDVDNEFRAIIPITMVGNSSPEPYVISASSVYLDNYLPWWALDGRLISSNAGWVSGNVEGLPAWWKIDFGSSIYTIREYILHPWSGGYYIKAWTFEGSNNNSDWDVIDTQVNQIDTTPLSKTYVFNNVIAYRYYRMNITEAITSTGDPAPYAYISELEFVVYGAQALSIINDAAYASRTTPSTIYDFFNRADTVSGTLGISDSGHAWKTYGSWNALQATETNISNNTWISEPGDLCYAVYVADKKISRMGASISFVPGPGEYSLSAFAMAWSASDGATFVYNMIHLAVTPEHYELKYMVEGVPTSISDDTFTTPLSIDGTIYNVELSLFGTYAKLSIGPYSYNIINSELLSRGEYRVLFWEHYYTSANTSVLLKIHGVWSSDIVGETSPLITDVLASGIVNGDTTHAPDGNSVYNALASKVPYTELASTTSGLEGAKLVGYTDNQTVHDMIDSYANRGILNGCNVTTTSGLNIIWDAGYLFDRATGSVITIVSGSGVCTDNTINYLKWPGGSELSLGVTEPVDNEIHIARIDTFVGVVHLIDHGTYLNDQVATSRRAIRAMFPLVVTDGLTFSEKPGGGTWDVVSAAGEFYSEGTNPITVPALDSTVSPYIIRVFRSSGVWQYDANTSIDPTKWDNGTNLVAVTSNKYYKSLFMLGHSTMHWIYPQVEYNTIAEAVAAPMPTIPTGLSLHPTITCVVLKGSATSFPVAGSEQWIDVRPRLAGPAQPATISDHGSLAGLTDDDHSQYILADGTRAFSSAVSGVTPTSAAHLATKDYVDTELSTISGAVLTDILASGIVNGDTTHAPSGNAVFDALSLTRSFKNRIINGDMNIAIQYGTTEITPTAASTIVVDRWKYLTNVASILKFKQTAITDLPNFYYSLKVTTVTQHSPGAAEYFLLTQLIEGYNLQDFNFGTANASPFVISFWAKASIGGLYTGSVRNSANDRHYIFNYTVQTYWTRVEINIPGDTTGTWTDGNSIGIQVHFCLGTGATYGGDAGSWASGAAVGDVGSPIHLVDLDAGSTFEVTGVQFEKGEDMTDFEIRPFAVEKVLCSRYQQWLPFNKYYAPPAANIMYMDSISFPEMRTVPTASTIVADPNCTQYAVNNSVNSFNYLTVNGCGCYLQSAAAGVCYVCGYRSLLYAEL
jgi:hypothetical protein